MVAIFATFKELCFVDVWSAKMMPGEKVRGIRPQKDFTHSDDGKALQEASTQLLSSICTRGDARINARNHCATSALFSITLDMKRRSSWPRRILKLDLTRLCYWNSASLEFTGMTVTIVLKEKYIIWILKRVNSACLWSRDTILEVLWR